jgi:hypothetical protein
MGLKVSIKRVNGDGSTQEYEYTSKLTCAPKSTPSSAKGPTGQTQSRLTSQPPTQFNRLCRRKEIATATSVVSKDERVLTITAKGVDASGKPFNSVAVYDKQ